jgi:hypothetical protein
VWPHASDIVEYAPGRCGTRPRRADGPRRVGDDAEPCWTTAHRLHRRRVPFGVLQADHRLRATGGTRRVVAEHGEARADLVVERIAGLGGHPLFVRRAPEDGVGDAGEHVSVRRLGDHQCGLSVVDHVLDLVAQEAERHRHQGGADPTGADDQLEELDAVAQPDRHPVTLADPTPGAQATWCRGRRARAT